jgi:hypothetical protein
MIQNGHFPIHHARACRHLGGRFQLIFASGPAVHSSQAALNNRPGDPRSISLKPIAFTDRMVLVKYGAADRAAGREQSEML